jgi:hypothetical protein
VDAASRLVAQRAERRRLVGYHGQHQSGFARIEVPGDKAEAGAARQQTRKKIHAVKYGHAPQIHQNWPRAHNR